MSQFFQNKFVAFVILKVPLGFLFRFRVKTFPPKKVACRNAQSPVAHFPSLPLYKKNAVICTRIPKWCRKRKVFSTYSIFIFFSFLSEDETFFGGKTFLWHTKLSTTGWEEGGRGKSLLYSPFPAPPPLPPPPPLPYLPISDASSGASLFLLL